MTLNDKLNWMMGIHFEENNPLEEVTEYVLDTIQDYKEFCENNSIINCREQYLLNVIGIQELCAVYDLACHPFVNMYQVGVQDESEGRFDNSHLHG